MPVNYFQFLLFSAIRHRTLWSHSCYLSSDKGHFPKPCSYLLWAPCYSSHDPGFFAQSIFILLLSVINICCLSLPPSLPIFLLHYFFVEFFTNPNFHHIISPIKCPLLLYISRLPVPNYQLCYVHFLISWGIVFGYFSFLIVSLISIFVYFPFC